MSSFCRTSGNPTFVHSHQYIYGVAFGGNDLCSYRVRGVDGSYAKHLAVESYTVVMLLTFALIIISIPSPMTLSFQAQNLLFLQILPTVAFLFFSRTDSTDSPDCLLIGLLLSISVFYFLVFSVFHIFVVGCVR